MPGRFYTYIAIDDVAHKETGRKAALRKFVFLHVMQTIMILLMCPNQLITQKKHCKF